MGTDNLGMHHAKLYETLYPRGGTTLPKFQRISNVDELLGDCASFLTTQPSPEATANADLLRDYASFCLASMYRRQAADSRTTHADTLQASDMLYDLSKLILHNPLASIDPSGGMKPGQKEVVGFVSELALCMLIVRGMASGEVPLGSMVIGSSRSSRVPPGLPSDVDLRGTIGEKRFQLQVKTAVRHHNVSVLAGIVPVSSMFLLGLVAGTDTEIMRKGPVALLRLVRGREIATLRPARDEVLRKIGYKVKKSQ